MSNTSNRDIYCNLDKDNKARIIRFRKMAINKFKNETTIKIGEWKKRYDAKKTVHHVRKPEFTNEHLLKLMVSYEMASVVCGINANKSVLKTIFLICTSTYFTSKIQSPSFDERAKKETDIQNNFIFKHSDWNTIKTILFYDRICTDMVTAVFVALGINNNKNKIRIKIEPNQKEEWINYGFSNESVQNKSHCLPSAILSQPKTIRFKQKINYHLQSQSSRTYNPRQHATDGDEPNAEQLRNKILTQPATMRIAQTTQSNNMNRINTIGMDIDESDTDTATNRDDNKSNNEEILLHSDTVTNDNSNHNVITENTENTENNPDEAARITLNDDTLITIVNRNAILVSTPNDYSITMVSMTYDDVSIYLISPKTWHQYEYLEADDIGGAVAPIMAKMCQILSDKMIPGIEYLTKYSFMAPILQPTEDDTTQIMMFEEFVKALNDDRKIREQLKKIAIQITNQQLNTNNHALKRLVGDVVETIVALNPLFVSHPIIVIANAHQLPGAIMDGLWDDEIDTKFDTLNIQLSNNGITDSFIVQIDIHYFALTLHRISETQYSFIIVDSLNPGTHALLQCRTFPLLFKLIVQYPDINRLHLCCIDLIAEVQRHISRFDRRTEFNAKMIGKIFKIIINFKRFESKYYDARNEQHLNRISTDILDDLQLKYPHDLSNIKTMDEETHTANAEIYLQCLQPDTTKRLQHILMQYELSRLVRNSKTHLKNIVGWNNISNKTEQWDPKIIESIHIYHSCRDLFDKNDSWDAIQSQIAELDVQMNELTQKLYEHLFSSYFVLQDVTCDACEWIVKHN